MHSLKQNKAKTIYFIVSIIIITLAAAWAGSTTYTAASRQLTMPSVTEAVAPTEVHIVPQPEMYFNTLVLGIDPDGLGDVIIIASYNLYTNQVILTSVPRDTYVENQTWAEQNSGASHLCYANYAAIGPKGNDYHNGAAYTAYWLEILFGIPIHEYVVVTYEGFVELVDLIGGIEIHVDPAFGEVVPSFNRVIKEPLPTGLQRLNGEQVFAYAHYRGAINNPRIPELNSNSEDGDRIRRNQRLIKAAFSQVRSMKLNEIINIARQVPDLVHTSYTLFDLTALAPDLYKVNTEDLITMVIPGEMVEVFEEGSNENTYYFFIDFEKTKELLQTHGLI